MRTTTGTPLDRVAERQRAVALARHFREAEGLSIAQIAQRLGRTPATVKGYFYDPSHANKRPTDSWRANAWAGCPAPPAGLGF
jgi:predicted transcriptional regulator